MFTNKKMERKGSTIISFASEIVLTAIALTLIAKGGVLIVAIALLVSLI